MSRRITLSLWLLAGLLTVMTFMATGFGALRLPVNVLWSGSDETLRQIWLTIRLPRVLLALVIGVPLGILSAVYRNRWLDHLVRLMAMTGISTPAFWLGLGVIVLFYGQLQILPGGGRLDDWLDPPAHVTGFYLLDALLEGNGEVFFNALQHLILPSLTLAFVHLGIVARQDRKSVV